MLIPDMPNMPPQNVPVLIAQANQAKTSGTAKVRTIGVCNPSPNNNYSLDNLVNPIAQAGNYLHFFEHRKSPSTATTTIVQQPNHGLLRLATQADVGPILEPGGDPVDPVAGLHLYLPHSSYVGKDNAIIQVDYGNGLKIHVKYFFQAIDMGVTDNWMEKYCSKTGYYWKISTNHDANDNNTRVHLSIGRIERTHPPTNNYS